MLDFILDGTTLSEELSKSGEIYFIDEDIPSMIGVNEEIEERLSLLLRANPSGYFQLMGDDTEEALLAVKCSVKSFGRDLLIVDFNGLFSSDKKGERILWQLK